MDLVDFFRIVLRRWYVALAVAVAGSLVAVLLAWSVAPQYAVEAQSILISGRASPSESNDSAANPYMSFSGSLFTTLSAVTRTVDGQESREVLGADGSEQDFTFTTSQEAPVIITTSISATPEGASALSDEVQKALSATLVTLQSAEDVPEEQQITMRVLTTSSPEEETGDRTRVLLGVIGLSLASAVGAAVLVESIAQARRRSRAESVPVVQGDVTVQGPPADSRPPSATSRAGTS